MLEKTPEGNRGYRKAVQFVVDRLNGVPYSPEVEPAEEPITTEEALGMVGIQQQIPMPDDVAQTWEDYMNGYAEISDNIRDGYDE